MQTFIFLLPGNNSVRVSSLSESEAYKELVALYPSLFAFFAPLGSSARPEGPAILVR
jgi:hypothetical protein